MLLPRFLDPSRHRPGLRLMTLKALRGMPRHAAESAIRRLCASVPVEDAMMLCRVLGRYKMFTDAGDFGLSPHLMLDGYWEMWVTEAILDVVGSGMVAVDIGANLGYFTLLLADIVGSAGHVHAVEPNPRILRLLGRSVAVNGFAGRVTLHDRPLGSRVGDAVRLVVPPGDPKNAHLSPGPAAEGGQGVTSFDLHTTTLDAIVGDGRVDVVKIDAEGAEHDIWTGMTGILARASPLVVVMEFVAARYPAPDAFLAEIAAAGFRLRRIDPRRGVEAVTPAELLRAPSDVDQMLMLSRMRGPHPPTR